MVNDPVKKLKGTICITPTRVWSLKYRNKNEVKAEPAFYPPTVHKKLNYTNTVGKFGSYLCLQEMYKSY